MSDIWTHFVAAVWGWIFACVFMSMTSKHTSMYREGRVDTLKEAFSLGLAKKEIDKDDKVIYRWSETRPIGY